MLRSLLLLSLVAAAVLGSNCNDADQENLCILQGTYLSTGRSEWAIDQETVDPQYYLRLATWGLSFSPRERVFPENHTPNAGLVVQWWQIVSNEGECTGAWFALARAWCNGARRNCPTLLVLFQSKIARDADARTALPPAFPHHSSVRSAAVRTSVGNYTMGPYNTDFCGLQASFDSRCEYVSGLKDLCDPLYDQLGCSEDQKQNTTTPIFFLTIGRQTDCYSFTYGGRNDWLFYNDVFFSSGVRAAVSASALLAAAAAALLY